MGNPMTILWIVPMTIDENPLYCVKNEYAKAIKKQGYYISTIVGFNKYRPFLDGFSNVKYYKIRKLNFLYKIIYHFVLQIETIRSNVDVIIFGINAAHLIPIAKLGMSLHKRKILVLDVRTVPVDVKPSLKGIIQLLRYKLAIKIADKFCNGITTITPLLAETIRPKLRRLKNKIGYFSTGVNFELFNPENAVSLKDKLGLSGKFVLIYHGTLSPNRGLQNVVKAVANLRNEIKNLVFLLVGDGEAKSQILRLSKSLNISDRIIVTGQVPYNQVPSYIKSSDLGILPLPNIEWWNVSSPIKLKEYLAMQLPVIATDIPAHRNVIKHTGGAILIPDNSVDTISSAIKNFYQSRILQYDMRSRNQLEKIISYKTETKKLLKFLEKLKCTQ